MNKIVRNKLFEDPDRSNAFRRFGNYEHLSWSDDIAYPFGVNIQRAEILVGAKQTTHAQMEYLSPFSYGDYQGRIWPEDKVIAFWEAPTKTLLLHIFKKLIQDGKLKKYNIKEEDIHKYLFDIPNPDQTSNEEDEIYTYEEYPDNPKVQIKSTEFKVKERPQHTISPMKKQKKEVPYGFGSKHPKAEQRAKEKRERPFESLNESPDFVLDNISGEFIEYSDVKYEPITFGWYNNKLYVLTSEDSDNPNELTHDLLGQKYIKKKKENDAWRDVFEYPGRLWLKLKIITFWQYPTKEELQNRLKQLEKVLNVKIINDPKWRIEIKEDKKRKIIYLKDYIGSKNASPEELKQQHVLSPIEKAKKPKNSAYFKYGKNKPLAWKQAMTIGDSKNEIVRPSLNESPDCICMSPDSKIGISKKKPLTYDSAEGVYVDTGYYCKDERTQKARYFDKDARAFGIINVDQTMWGERVKKGLMWVGFPGETHDLGRDSYKYAGRIWLLKGIISFWEYPPQNEIDDVLNKIKNELERQDVNPDYLHLNNFWIEIIIEGGEKPTDIRKDLIWKGEVHTKFIRISDYKKLDKVVQPSKEQKEMEHVKSPLQKQKKEVPYGFGSKHPKAEQKAEERRKKPFESLVAESLNEAMVGDTEIADVESYISGMSKGVDDKIDFISKIKPDSILDFGCADGYVLNNIKQHYPNIKGFIGYDLDEKMLSRAQSKYPNLKFTDNWKEAVYLVGEYNNTALTLMSVIHEVYTYSSPKDIRQFWKQQVFNPEFEYVVIRDMMPKKEYLKIKPDSSDIHKIKRKIWSERKYRKSFERQWGSLNDNIWNMYHWLLKYDYKSNWSREVKENYFPVSIETVKSKIPSGWKIIYEDHYIFDPIANKVKKDFGIEIKYPTHVKMIIKNENHKR